jgi:hypothetical protein
MIGPLGSPLNSFDHTGGEGLELILQIQRASNNQAGHVPKAGQLKLNASAEKSKQYHRVGG